VIKRDVVYIPAEQEQTQESSISIDDIFAEADAEMKRQRDALSASPPVKKRRRYSIRNMLLTMAALSVIVIGCIIFVTISEINKLYPQMKDSLLYQVQSMQQQLLSIDDTTLTESEYYQKQLLLLFSADEIEAAIEDIEDVENFAKLFGNGEALPQDIIPKEKIEEYQALIDAYQNAIDKEKNVISSD